MINQTASLPAQLLMIVLSLVLPIVVTFAVKLGRRALEALEQKAMALISAEDRATIYAAVKIGQRAAAAYGIDPAGTLKALETAGIEAASRYLQSFGMPVEPGLLKDLLHAEYNKVQGQQLQVAEPVAPTYSYTGVGIATTGPTFRP